MAAVELFVTYLGRMARRLSLVIHGSVRSLPLPGGIAPRLAGRFDDAFARVRGQGAARRIMRGSRPTSSLSAACDRGLATFATIDAGAVFPRSHWPQVRGIRFLSPSRLSANWNRTFVFHEAQFGCLSAVHLCACALWGDRYQHPPRSAGVAQG
jgi:hypothetical protein